MTTETDLNLASRTEESLARDSRTFGHYLMNALTYVAEEVGATEGRGLEVRSRAIELANFHDKATLPDTKAFMYLEKQHPGIADYILDRAEYIHAEKYARQLKLVRNPFHKPFWRILLHGASQISLAPRPIQPRDVYSFFDADDLADSY